MSVIINGTDGVQFNDASLQGAAASPFGLKNKIINGDCRIDQRYAGASVSVSTSEVYTVDRWASRLASGSGHTVQRSTTAPTGFNYSLLATIGTGASPAAGDRNNFVQKIEGFNISDLDFGNANAKTITISFWVRSSLTGTFSGAISNSATNRSYPFTFVINSSNTFEQKSITITGDTTGTWLTDNGTGMFLWIDLGAGANYQGTAGAWAAADYRAVSGSTKLVATSGATFYITGVQLEVGSTATPFERRLYGQELANCQRYYETGGLYATGYGNGSNGVVFSYPMKVTKRATPTGTLTSAGYINYPSPLFTADNADTVYLTNGSVPATGFVRAIVTFNISSEL
jgi:hypothetical protein